MIKWDERFLDLCKLVASWSKDPSTKTGAAIIRPDNCVVSVGYNGFPPGVADDNRLQDRKTKYSLTVHCEMNTLLLTHDDVKGCTLYTYPFLSCDRCAVHVIRAGIKKVVAPFPAQDKLERWGESFQKTRLLFREVGIIVREVEYV